MTDNTEYTFGSLAEKFENYSKTSIELLKLKLAGFSANLSSMIIVFSFLFLIFTLIVFLISIGIALWIGDLLDKVYSGFFIVGLTYILIGILFYHFRNHLIKSPVSKIFTFLFDLEKQ